MRFGVFRTEEEIFGERVVCALRSYGGYDVDSVTIQRGLPPLIDEPERYLHDQSIFKLSDLIVSCIFERESAHPYSIRAHPDLNIYVAGLCEEHGKNLVAPRTEKISWQRSYEIRTASVEFGCILRRYHGGCLGEFTRKFGIPEFKVKVRSGRLEDVEVQRGALCGATWEVAKNIMGEKVSEAPRKAALLQQYLCTAPRSYDIFTGEERGLHKAGKLHLQAMKNAITEI